MESPIEFVELLSTASDDRLQPPRSRIILMPAAFQTLAQFREHGFDQALSTRHPHVELLLAAPRLAHLNDRRWIPALYQRLIAPARASGIRIWLGGVSLGGFMALRVAAQYPDALDGLCLLAPYLGSRIVATEVAADIANGADLRDWRDEDDDERRIWRYVARLDRSVCATRVFLGFGAGDRFADTQRLLAGLLPQPATTTRMIEGGHDWSVWRALWDAFLEDLQCPT
jgi:pimeloyl-ACP methyl ester carboxylesterase